MMLDSSNRSYLVIIIINRSTHVWYSDTSKTTSHCILDCDLY